jgi:acetone carboxylase gamma subunit
MPHGYDHATLTALLDGRLPSTQLTAMMSSFKDPDRFERMLAIYQERVPWTDRILLPYGEGLFIVETDAGERVVRCECGHDFGDYRVNWKLSALIFVRNTQDLIDELYPSMMGCDPDWMELREFYCPSCRRQLDVEAVPPGYPIVFDFEPDLDAFYAQWLESRRRGDQSDRVDPDEHSQTCSPKVASSNSAPAANGPRGSECPAA